MTELFKYELDPIRHIDAGNVTSYAEAIEQEVRLHVAEGRLDAAAEVLKHGRSRHTLTTPRAETHFRNAGMLLRGARIEAHFDRIEAHFDRIDCLLEDHFDRVDYLLDEIRKILEAGA